MSTFTGYTLYGQKIADTENTSDAALAERIRKDVRYLNANLAEAKRRGMRVDISDRDPKLNSHTQAPTYWIALDAHTHLHVHSITKTHTEKF